jgi:hypothetical protein
MPFRENNKLGAQKILKRSLDNKPICFMGYEGTREKLKSVPDWQNRLRDYVERLIAENTVI